MLSICIAAVAFVAPAPHAAIRPRVAIPSMIDVPRIPLPDVASDLIKAQGLKSPNEMSTDEYNSYSGAAIGGTLIFFLLPGAALTGLGAKKGLGAKGAAGAQKEEEKEKYVDPGPNKLAGDDLHAVDWAKYMKALPDPDP